MANGNLSFLGENELQEIMGMPLDVPPPTAAPQAVAPQGAQPRTAQPQAAQPRAAQSQMEQPQITPQQIIQQLFDSIEAPSAPNPPQMGIVRGIAGALSDALYMRARVLAGAAPTLGPFAAQQMEEQAAYREHQFLADQAQREMRNRIRLTQAQNNLNELEAIRQENREDIRHRDELEYERGLAIEDAKQRLAYDQKIDELRFIRERATELVRLNVLSPDTDINKLTMSDIMKLEGALATGRDDALFNLIATVKKADPDMQLVSLVPKADGTGWVPQFARRTADAPKPMGPAQRLNILDEGIPPTHPDGTPKTDPELEQEFAAVKRAQAEAKAKERETRLNKPIGRGAFTVKDQLREDIQMLIDTEDALAILEATPEGIGGFPGAGIVPQVMQSDARLKFEPIIARIKNLKFRSISGGAVTPQEEVRQWPEVADISDIHRVKISKLKALNQYFATKIAGRKTAYSLSDEDVESMYKSMKNAGFIPSPDEEGDLVLSDN